MTKISPILVTIIPSNFEGFFCHQFWWKFRWFDEIGEFLSDKNITNSGDNNSFRFWVLFVTNFSENSSDLKKLVSFWVKKMSPILVTIISFDFGFFLSQKLAKIQGNHQNWWQFCRKSMWAPIWEGVRGGIWPVRNFLIWRNWFVSLKMVKNDVAHIPKWCCWHS